MEWTAADVFQTFGKEGLLAYDNLQGVDWSWLPLDGGMTKAPLAGLPVSLAIDGANRYDMKLARATFESLIIPRPEPTPQQPQGPCLDKRYDYDEVRELAEEFGYTAPIRTRGQEAQTIKREACFKARRWAVERTHSWLNRFRRILIAGKNGPSLIWR